MTKLIRYAGALVAPAILSACGGGSALTPSNAALDTAYTGASAVNGMRLTGERTGLAQVPSYAPIVPSKKTTGKDFEYIINTYGSYASIFDYPKSVKQIGTIENVGGQGCTNVLYGYGKKTFWIVAGDNQISEYSVPKKLLRSLSDSIGMPSSCAMNTSGDLAVGDFSTGAVIFYKDAKGAGKAVSTPLSEEFFDGYDAKGDLFADGFAGAGFTFVELPKGSKTFEVINLPNSIDFPGSVQWDGTYITVFDQEANNLYQYTVKGTTATLKGTVSLMGASDCAQTWLATGILYCGNAPGLAYKYPKGGSPLATFSGNFDSPLGVVASAK